MTGTMKSGPKARLIYFLVSDGIEIIKSLYVKTFFNGENIYIIAFLILQSLA